MTTDHPNISIHLFECMNTSIYIYYSTNSQQQATDRTSDTGQTGDDNNNNYLEYEIRNEEFSLQGSLIIPFNRKRIF